MLLKFIAKNYKSFRDTLEFSMIPAPKQKGLDFSILRQKAGAKGYKALCSAVLYGPNASGKTNIIGAMDTLKNIMLRGHIRNSDGTGFPNVAAHILGLIPNVSNTERQPIGFSVTFIEEGVLVEYSLSADVGRITEKDPPRKILFEELKVNGNQIYSRGKELMFGDLKAIKRFWVNGFSKNQKSVIELAQGNLSDEELFLTSSFKSMFSNKLVTLITNWFNDKFTIIYRADSVRLKRVPASQKKVAVINIEEPLRKAVSCFGAANDLSYFTHKGPEGEAETTLMSEISDNKGAALATIPAELFESYGTIRFLNLFPLVMDAITNGGILVVDEFDASIHPMALMSIVNIFHNDDINKKQAQLIFNTHNPIFLNAGLFRRDEIKFVDRDEKTHVSTHYSLSDFGTSGEKGVRKGEDFLKNYFVDRYGAIKDIDFTPIFEAIVDADTEV